MRLSSLGLILYVLVLLTVPCQDAFPRVNPSTTDSAIAKSELPSNQQSSQDECSPFCTCSCCSVSIVHQDISSLFASESAAVISESRILGHRNPYIKNHHSSIWQPPKA
jgi:hypothetical protein